MTKGTERTIMGVGWVIVIVAAAWALVVVVTLAMDVREIGECRRWQRDAERYPGYYLTQWQKDQCDAQTIFIKAPVKQ